MAPMIHSPLESLLLLQSLHPYDGEHFAPSFDRAADSLKSNKLLKDNGYLDSERLLPETLKGLYLCLVKEQAKIEAASRDGSPSKEANPRKRKLSSPPIQSVDEAAQYTHLLPRLLDRLYIQFKDETVKSVEAEEREYRKIQSLQHHTSEARAARPGSQGVPPISALLRETEESAQPRPPAPVEPIINGIGQHETHPPPHEQRNLHADIYNPRSQPNSADNGPPFLPPPAPPSQPYPLPSNMDRRNSTQMQGPSASPHLNQTPLPPTDRSSASPIILPPPKGMVRASGSPPIPSPQQTHYPPPRQPSNQSASGRHGQRAFTYYDNQGYPIPYPPYNGNSASMYHPYHATAPHGTHQAPYAAHPYQSPVPAQHSTYYSQYPQAVQTPYAQTTPQYPDTRTSLPTSQLRQRVTKPSPILTSGSVTKWKKIDASFSATAPASPTRPQSRDISPISDVESLPDRDKTAASKRGGRAAKVIREQTQADNEKSPAQDRKTGRTRGGRGRGAGARGRGGRAGSVGSSTVADSRRSHSITEDSATVKPEPSATYDESAAIASHTDEPSRKPGRLRRNTLRGEDTDQQPQKAKRKRDELSPPFTPSGKQMAIESPGPTSVAPKKVSRKPGHILATRNFSRLTAPLLTDLSGHRLAALFAKPVLEKDAPGYHHIILQPQDLKSIKAAISAGGRALTAFLESLGDDAPENGAHIWVPENENLKPPKGIVNPAQLEKELMHMYANAAMFNNDIQENRDLGPAYHTRKTYTTKAMAKKSQKQTAGSEASKFEIGVAAPEEGATLQDTRVVLKDAEESFSTWRAIESERDNNIVDLDGTGPDAGGEEAEDDAQEGVKQSVEEGEEGERRSKRRRR